MGVLDEVLAANAEYAADFGARSELWPTPARAFAILTCMDARLDPAKFAGLSEGDAHVIRNAGGRASDDAIRSLIISHKLLGTNEWFVIQHTECGMEGFSEEKMRALLGSGRGGLQHRLARDLESPAERPRRRHPAPLPPARLEGDPDLRLHLRREDRQAGRGARGHGRGTPELDG